MPELEFDHLVLRYGRQIILKTMDHVRGAKRGENCLNLKRAVADPQLQKSAPNLTKAVDCDAEHLILDALQQKFTKLPGVKAYTVSSEELGIKTFPEGASRNPRPKGGALGCGRHRRPMLIPRAESAVRNSNVATPFDIPRILPRTRIGGPPLP